MNRKQFLHSGLTAAFGAALPSSLSAAPDSTNPKSESQSAIKATFPKFGDPIQITSDDKEHFYASYMGINSFSDDDKYALVLETDLRIGMPTGKEAATLGLVELETKKFIPLTTTRAWNFQQGCMGFWLGIAPNDQIIFNDFRDGKFVSVIMDVHTKKELKVFPLPVGDVSEDGKTAVSINFSRIWITRKSYGYGGEGQPSQPDVQFPDDDGIFHMNLQTGESKLIVSYADMKSFMPEIKSPKIAYIGHVKISRNAQRIFWLARDTPPGITVSLSANIDGSNVRHCFPEGWGGSHFDWLNDEQMVVTAKFDDIRYTHVFFSVEKGEHVRLGDGLFDFDGHCVFSPDGRYMTTDTYHSPFGTRQMFIYDRESQAARPLGEFADPDEFNTKIELTSDTAARCDLHARWSRSGRILGFNSVMSGKRQAYVLKS